MSKPSTGVDPSLFEIARSRQQETLDSPRIQKVVPVTIGEPEGPMARIGLRVPLEFKDNVEKYRAEHAAQLRELGCRTKEAFIQYALTKYMVENP